MLLLEVFQKRKGEDKGEEVEERTKYKFSFYILKMFLPMSYSSVSVLLIKKKIAQLVFPPPIIMVWRAVSWVQDLSGLCNLPIKQKKKLKKNSCSCLNVKKKGWRGSRYFYFFFFF